MRSITPGLLLIRHTGKEFLFTFSDFFPMNHGNGILSIMIDRFSVFLLQLAFLSGVFLLP
jgi:hypothetical protein